MKRTELKEIIRKIIKEEYPKSVNSPNWTSTTTGIETSSSKKRIPKAKGNFEEPTDENLYKYKLKPDKVTINSDGSIDYDGNLDLSAKKLKKIPFKFNKISGSFNCSWNNLTSLSGCPKKVGRYFICDGNQLTSLSGSPDKVGKDFRCYGNKTQFTEEEVRKVCKVIGRVYNKGKYQY